MTTAADVLVIGAGIAGASAAAELAVHRGVTLLEAEASPGYHATGRSAAYFAPGYGNRTVRAVTAAAEHFFRTPPPGFTEVALLRARECVYFARPDQVSRLCAEAEELGDQAQRIDGQELIERMPIMRPGYAEAGLVVAGGGDLDVDALLQGYLKQLKRHDGTLVTSVQVVAIERSGNVWLVSTGDKTFEAPVVVNAAGAWADQVAQLAGLGALEIQPKRRTACLIDPPDGVDVADWPLMIDIDEQFYFKPDVGNVLVSPADETPSPPCDAQPEDIDVAIAVDRFEKATTLSVGRVNHKWAGLRSFAPDKTPVAGFDPRADGFFWLAGQGGYGVQTAPGLSQLAAHLITGAPLSAGLEGLVDVVEELSPQRRLL
jgi:D-arginine dehydrogenase